MRIRSPSPQESLNRKKIENFQKKQGQKDKRRNKQKQKLQKERTEHKEARQFIGFYNEFVLSEPKYSMLT